MIQLDFYPRWLIRAVPTVVSLCCFVLCIATINTTSETAQGVCLFAIFGGVLSGVVALIIWAEKHGYVSAESRKRQERRRQRRATRKERAREFRRLMEMPMSEWPLRDNLCDNCGEIADFFRGTKEGFYVCSNCYHSLICIVFLSRRTVAKRMAERAVTIEALERECGIGVDR